MGIHGGGATMVLTAIRAYERSDLPLAERLPSLGRRFPSLADAAGLDPWNADRLFAWISERGAQSPAFHAGLLLLNLHGRGPWPPFDVLAAARVWDDEDRQMFIDWMRVWRF